MLLAFVIAAAVCAIVIVGPRQALWGAGVRIAQLAGALGVMLGIGIVMTYVIPLIVLAALCLAGFAALVAASVYFFGLPGGSGSQAATTRRLNPPGRD